LSDVYAAYRQWCAEQGIKPMTPFGTTPPWEKSKSGSVWYRDIRLAAGYSKRRLMAVNG
jgi:hypothetical protein